MISAGGFQPNEWEEEEEEGGDGICATSIGTAPRSASSPTNLPSLWS